MNYILKIMLTLLPAVFSPLITLDCQAEQPLVVKLDTELQLQPLFLARFANENSGLDSDYIEQLENVLQFDLSHSGLFQLLPHTRDRHLLSTSHTLQEAGISNQWKALNAMHVVKVRLQGNRMIASLLSIRDNTLKTMDNFPLSGDLSKDRRQIHHLSDALVKMLSGTQGIASTRILFTCKSHDAKLNKWASEVWESDYDGGNARKVLGEENGYCVTPTYISPKPGHRSNAFFYVSYKNGQPKIYLGTLADGNAQRLTSMRGNQLMPAISRQRNKIAFICDITGNPDLFLQEFNPETGLIGKPRQIFTAPQGTQGSPTFSPDGTRIAFVSNKDGNPRIYSMNIPALQAKLKEIKPKLISRANRESSAPCWSPDGTKLAYCAKNGEARQIWIYDFETDQEWELTQGPENKENPSWAPNSLHLVYNTTGNSKTDLFLVNLNDPTPVKINLMLHGEVRFASWEPI